MSAPPTDATDTAPEVHPSVDATFDVQFATQLDIVWVVDASGSMNPHWPILFRVIEQSFGMSEQGAFPGPGTAAVFSGRPVEPRLGVMLGRNRMDTPARLVEGPHGPWARDHDEVDVIVAEALAGRDTSLAGSALLRPIAEWLDGQGASAGTERGALFLLASNSGEEIVARVESTVVASTAGALSRRPFAEVGAATPQDSPRCTPPTDLPVPWIDELVTSSGGAVMDVCEDEFAELLSRTLRNYLETEEVLTLDTEVPPDAQVTLELMRGTATLESCALGAPGGCMGAWVDELDRTHLVVRRGALTGGDRLRVIVEVTP